jgi:hypothetical protein
MSETQSTKEEKATFIKKFEARAVKQRMTPAEYLATTATDQVRETMLRMIDFERKKLQGAKDGKAQEG